MPDIKIQGADGSFGAYFAAPASGSGPALVVIQEIFGVNRVMRELCDAYAADGYFAICPDLFWRIEPGIQLTDGSEAEWNRAFELMTAFLPNFQSGVADLMATLAYARSVHGATGKGGCVGYCLGGSLAYAMACASDCDASVGYYPVQIEDSLKRASGIKKPAMFHLAEKDGLCPPEAQARIRAALDPIDAVTLNSYQGVDHAFARPGGQNYDETAADLANSRTAEFFKTHLA
ncbi:MAG: dienelactone hydrolase family protein [Alphaproteobacteria bacterium]